MHGVVYLFRRVFGADLVARNPFDEAWITFWTIQVTHRCNSNHKTFLIHGIFFRQLEGLSNLELRNCRALPLKHVLQLEHSEHEGEEDDEDGEAGSSGGFD